ncbi:type II secretion system F family protein [Thalassobius sp. Cn5-15]|uniref:type II secretion system F family protein n=1 Tax=Thalassobius sp. Cn5-15 TaxID=2917763 RepID=UPI001EF39C68|nr:type II secretion system F family protein [Thalassobius sp. Cn5-15]MCG7493195.1 type II secretion system F family protein [Thalassobius sp. Cn5-15]
MSVPIEVVIYGLVFIGVLVIVEGIYLTMFGKSISLNSKVNRRLDMMEQGKHRSEVMDTLRKEMSQHMQWTNFPVYSLLASKAQKAALAFSPMQLIGMMGALSVMAFVALTVGTATDLVVRAGISVAMGVGGIFIWVSMKAKKRMSMIEEQLPDGIELMVRSLRVGHPFNSAIQIVSREIDDPLASEFGMIADEAQYGRDVGEALQEMADRLDMQDLRFLAVAVTIQQQSGGNLAEILDGLAKVIRARFRLFRRVKAITAEAQWSGKFLSGFPLMALVGINLLEPNYYDEVMDHAMFIPACVAVGVFLAANMFVMRMLVNIKV